MVVRVVDHVEHKVVLKAVVAVERVVDGHWCVPPMGARQQRPA